MTHRRLLYTCLGKGLCVCLCGLILAPVSACNRQAHTPDPEIENDGLIREIWRPLSEQCELTLQITGENEQEIVVCPKPVFQQSLLDMVALEENRDLLEKQVEIEVTHTKEAVALAGVDKMEMSGQVATLQDRLDRLWRWFWGVTSAVLVIGFGTGFAIGFTK